MYCRPTTNGLLSRKLVSLKMLTLFSLCVCVCDNLYERKVRCITNEHIKEPAQTIGNRYISLNLNLLLQTNFCNKLPICIK